MALELKEVNKKVVSGFAWEGSTKLIVQVLSWSVTIIIARILSPTEYGILAIATIFIDLLSAFAEMGLTSGLVNRKDVNEKQIAGVFWISLLTGILLYCGIFFVAPFIAAFYELPILTDILRFSGIVIILSSLKVVPTAILMRSMNFKHKALGEMAGHFANSVTAIALALAGFGVWSLVWSLIVNHIVLVLIFILVLKRIPAFGFFLKETLPVIYFGVKLLAANMLEYLMLRADVFVVGTFIGKQAVGFYAMAFQLATIPLDKVGAIFNTITFPAISRVKNNIDDARALFLKMHRYLLIIAFPVLAGFSLTAEDVVILFLTEKWEPAVFILQAICIINLLRVSGMIMPYVLEGLGKANRVLQFHFNAVILLPLAFFLGSYRGLEGVILAWFIAYPLLYIFVLSLVLKYLELSIWKFLESIVSPICATAIMALSVFFAQQICSDLHIALRLIISIGVGILSYMGTYLLLFRSEVSDVKTGLQSLRGE